jgi:hypothetical protein
MNHTKLHDENHNRTSRQRKHISHLVYSSDKKLQIPCIRYKTMDSHDQT